MQSFQTSLFYDLQELIRNSPLLRKYYYIFKALDLSALHDKNELWIDSHQKSDDHCTSYRIFDRPCCGKAFEPTRENAVLANFCRPALA